MAFWVDVTVMSAAVCRDIPPVQVSTDYSRPLPQEKRLPQIHVRAGLPNQGLSRKEVAGGVQAMAAPVLRGGGPLPEMCD